MGFVAPFITAVAKTAATSFVGNKVAKSLAPKPKAPAAPAAPLETKSEEVGPAAADAAASTVSPAARTVFSVARQAAKRKGRVSAASTQLSGSNRKLG